MAVVASHRFETRDVRVVEDEDFVADGAGRGGGGRAGGTVEYVAGDFGDADAGGHGGRWVRSSGAWWGLIEVVDCSRGGDGWEQGGELDAMDEIRLEFSAHESIYL